MLLIAQNVSGPCTSARAHAAADRLAGRLGFPVHHYRDGAGAEIIAAYGLLGPRCVVCRRPLEEGGFSVFCADTCDEDRDGNLVPRAGSRLFAGCDAEPCRSSLRPVGSWASAPWWIRWLLALPEEVS